MFQSKENIAAMNGGNLGKHSRRVARTKRREDDEDGDEEENPLWHVRYPPVSIDL